jgi:hypothetical protein
MTEGLHVEARHIESSIVDDSLGHILHSVRFKESPQLQALLKYIVEKSLAGQDEVLKERIIGIEVFGRKSDYDTADDPIVRSRVGLLRKRLAQYYASEESRGAEVEVVIPNGTYRPTFVLRPAIHNESKGSPTHNEPQLTVYQETEETKESEKSAPILRSLSAANWRTRGIAAVASCALLLAAWAAVARWQNNELYLLWGPILENKRAVLLYTGSINPVYLPSGDPIDRASSSSDQELPAGEPSLSPLEGAALTSTGFVPLRDGLAPPGDIAADMKVAALMNTYNRNLSLRTGSGLPFVDLQGTPTVLIGAYDNYWTMSLARDLPFFFDRGGRIRERGGQRRVWSSVARADSTISEDYAVVFRLLDSKAGGPVIAIAGLTTCGTQAAAQFVTDTAQVKKLSGIPRDSLARKNLEFILHASLVNCTPTSVNIVAQQVW